MRRQKPVGTHAGRVLTGSYSIHGVFSRKGAEEKFSSPFNTFHIELAQRAVQGRESLVCLLMSQHKRRIDTHARRISHRLQTTVETRTKQGHTFFFRPKRTVFQKIKTQQKTATAHVLDAAMSLSQNSKSAFEVTAHTRGVFA